MTTKPLLMTCRADGARLIIAIHPDLTAHALMRLAETVAQCALARRETERGASHAQPVARA